MELLVVTDNEVNLCDSCKHLYPECGSENINFGTGKGLDNIAACAMYEPSLIKNNEHHFPNRNLEPEEIKLIICQIIKYTSNAISYTMHPEDSIAAKMVDSNLIRKFMEHDDDEGAHALFVDIGASARIKLTRKRELLGLEPMPSKFLVDRKSNKTN